MVDWRFVNYCYQGYPGNTGLNWHCAVKSGCETGFENVNISRFSYIPR
jgi:hypothetical protein